MTDCNHPCIHEAENMRLRAEVEELRRERDAAVNEIARAKFAADEFSQGDMTIEETVDALWERVHERAQMCRDFKAVLSELEWKAMTLDGDEYCLYCENQRWEGHKWNCELAYALNK